MAKPKTAPSAAMIAAESARERVKIAQAALLKKKDANTEKELAAAKAHLAIAKKEENRDRFRRIGNPRMGAAKRAIQAIAKLGTPSSYEYEEADIAKIESVLADTVKSTAATLRSAKTKSGPAKAANAETFF